MQARRANKAGWMAAWSGALALCAAGAALPEAAPTAAPGSTRATASDAAVRGRNLAAGCAICHGPGGVSVDVVPSLAGMPRAQTVAAMQAFKRGTREGTVMPQLARGMPASEGTTSTLTPPGP